MRITVYWDQRKMGKQAQYGGGWEEIKHKNENSRKTNECSSKEQCVSRNRVGKELREGILLCI